MISDKFLVKFKKLKLTKIVPNLHGRVRVSFGIGNLAVIFVKGQLISECLFDFLNFPKNHRKI